MKLKSELKMEKKTIEGWINPEDLVWFIEMRRELSKQLFIIGQEESEVKSSRRK